MIDKLREIIQRHEDLTVLMSQPETASDPKRYAVLAKEHSGLSEVAQKARTYADLWERQAEAEELITCDDPDLKELAQEELPEIKEQLEQMEESGAVRAEKRRPSLPAIYTACTPATLREIIGIRKSCPCPSPRPEE
jgi:protein subunit release factor A